MTPQRRPRAELESLVVDAAVELIELGLGGVGGSGLTYASVFPHLEHKTGVRVTRGSVHERIWDSQHDFRMAAVVATARRMPHPWLPTAHHLREALAEAGTGDGERDLWRVGDRLGHIVTEHRNPLWSEMLAQLASQAENDAIHPALAREIAERSGAITSAWQELFVDMLPALDRHPRPALTGNGHLGWPATTRLLALETAAAIEGQNLRLCVDPAAASVLLRGPQDETRRWSASGLMITAFVARATEIAV